MALRTMTIRFRPLGWCLVLTAPLEVCKLRSLGHERYGGEVALNALESRLSSSILHEAIRNLRYILLFRGARDSRGVKIKILRLSCQHCPQNKTANCTRPQDNRAHISTPHLSVPVLLAYIPLPTYLPTYLPPYLPTYRPSYTYLYLPIPTYTYLSYLYLPIPTYTYLYLPTYLPT